MLAMRVVDFGLLTGRVIVNRIQSFSKAQWTKAKKTDGVMVRITVRHADGYAYETEGVFDTGSQQHDLACTAQRALLRLPLEKTNDN